MSKNDRSPLVEYFRFSSDSAQRPSALRRILGIARQSWLPCGFLLLFLCFWEVAAHLFRIPTYLIPAPSVIASAGAAALPVLITDAKVTILEALLGFIVGSLLGFLVGIIFSHSKFFERALYPYFIGMQAVPIVALAPLLAIWFGSGLAGKVVLAAFICIFPVVVNTVVGLRQVDREALEMMEIFFASRRQVLLKLRLPASLPYIFAGLRVASTLSVVGAIVAEIAGARAGLGYRVLVSSYRTDTALMFSAIILSAGVGVLFFGIVCLLERLLTWSPESTTDIPQTNSQLTK